MNVTTWPTAREYTRAIVDPASRSDAELRRATVECVSVGKPRAYSGSFATIFHLATAQGDVAFRCFTRGHDESVRRYTAICELLRFASIDALCSTRFEREALIVRDTPWPAVIMEWVVGEPLNAFVARRYDNGDAMRLMAEEFRGVLRSLGALGIAHGDLQHGNVFVSPRGLRLIDYDAMFVPTLAGLAQTEFGHRNYQHPARRNAAFDSRLDRFSALVVYTALVALSADRSLWPRFDDGENLLFRAHDFTSGGRSELMRAMLANSAASGLAEVVVMASRGPVDDVPTLEDAIAMAAGTTGRYVPIPPPRPTLPSEPAIFRARPTTFGPPPPSERDERKIVRVARPRWNVASFVPYAAILLIVGFAIGAGIAILRHGNRVAIVRIIATSAPQLLPMRAPLAVRKVRAKPAKPAIVAIQTISPIAAVTTSPTIAPTMVPTVTAAPIPLKRNTLPTALPALPHVAKSAVDAAPGAWNVAEANHVVGTIVWTGTVLRRDASTVELSVHKASVAGQSATPCERATTLHASFEAGVTGQVVPFRETNCRGATSGGEIHIARFAADAASFDGSVWQDGSKLGEFSATKR